MNNFEMNYNVDDKERDIMKNIYLYLTTKDERYHGTAVNLLKGTYNLIGNGGNKIFWVMVNNMKKVLKDNDNIPYDEVIDKMNSNKVGSK